jgi:hypothetical protein
MAVMIQMEVFWIVMLCNVVGYQYFKGPCCLLEVEVVRMGKMA